MFLFEVSLGPYLKQTKTNPEWHLFFRSFENWALVEAEKSSSVEPTLPVPQSPQQGHAPFFAPLDECPLVPELGPLALVPSTVALQNYGGCSSSIIGNLFTENLYPAALRHKGFYSFIPKTLEEELSSDYSWWPLWSWSLHQPPYCPRLHYENNCSDLGETLFSERQ